MRTGLAEPGASGLRRRLFLPLLFGGLLGVPTVIGIVAGTRSAAAFAQPLLVTLWVAAFTPGSGTRWEDRWVIKAVIFDFSGTLFRCEETESWLRAALGQAGFDASGSDIRAAATRLAASGGQPGGPPPTVDVPSPVARLWADRDSSAPAHRAAYTGLIGLAELPWPGLEDTLYDRHTVPDAWSPYPDTVAALELLAARSVPAAVVSNIGWDLRPVFRHHGVDDLIQGYLLSYEEGVCKPDPRIFLRACELAGHDPADVLMIGDDPVADAGATSIGCAFRAVAQLPPADRPRALLDAVEDAGR